ncbi:MAG: cation:proton antiporter [Gammaproteobacteria bacterium]|nr:cation:proton antiporter [Gammaproteobacteria bacterium]
MTEPAVIHVLFLVFTGAAVLAALALLARQSLLVAYVIAGLLVGPEVLDLLPPSVNVRDIGQAGIIFLLFLLGLNLHPQKLSRLLGPATRVTGISALAVLLIITPVAMALDVGLGEAAFVGVALGFSSTIIGLKLLPTTVLHHRHVGELIISILLLQDVIAIVMLLVVQILGYGGSWTSALLSAVGLPALALFAWGFSRYCLIPVLARFDTIPEYLFLATIGWCLGAAQAAHLLGLSHEMGAFVAGVALAAHPVSTYIAEQLKPLRDFFLILFFFALGAEFPLSQLADVVLPSVVLAFVVMVIKPIIYSKLLIRSGEEPRLAREVGVRLGQASEFSLLLVVLAFEAAVVGERVFLIVQGATLITFVASSYYVMNRYPTPIAVNERLRQH